MPFTLSVFHSTDNYQQCFVAITHNTHAEGALCAGSSPQHAQSKDSARAKICRFKRFSLSNWNRTIAAHHHLASIKWYINPRKELVTFTYLQCGFSMRLCWNTNKNLLIDAQTSWLYGVGDCRYSGLEDCADKAVLPPAALLILSIVNLFSHGFIILYPPSPPSPAFPGKLAVKPMAYWPPPIHLNRCLNYSGAWIYKPNPQLNLPPQHPL